MGRTMSDGQYVPGCVIDRLAAYEDTGLEPDEVLSVKLKADEFDRIMAMGNCNECAWRNSCMFRPGWGCTVRANCPLYRAEAVE